MENIDGKIALQEDNYARLTKAISNYKKSPKERITQSYIETRLENLNQAWKEFRETHCQLVQIVKRETKTKLQYFIDDWYTKYEDQYEDYKIKLKEDLCTCSKLKESQPLETGIAIGTNEVKLPAISLPKFSGNYIEWQTFYDMFLSLIHSNTSISAVQKFHYLKGNLVGEAELLLKNLAITEDNYEEAWKQLTRRYNNKRYNSNEILKRLLMQKSICGESASGVRQLLDVTVSCLKSLDSLGINTSSWDVFIVHITVNKLDPESRRQWEIRIGSTNSDELPTWQQLVEFLEMRFRTIEMIDSSCKSRQPVNVNNNNSKYVSKSKSFHSSIQEDKQRAQFDCMFCSREHKLYQCKLFGKQSPEERYSFVKSKRLCLNCFAPTHSVKSCHQSTCCRRCGRRHHTLLHAERANHQISAQVESCGEIEKVEKNDNITSSNVDVDKKVLSHFSNQTGKCDQVLLATALVQIKSKNGQKHIVRALLDQGSQASFITESTVQLLGMKHTPISGEVSGVGNAHTRIKNMTSFVLESCCDDNFTLEVNAFILNSLTSILPEREVPFSERLDTKKLILADSDYAKPGKIQLLLGAEVYSEILLEGIEKNPSGGLLAQNTRLGWIISGRIKAVSPSREILNFHLKLQEDQQLKRFWEIEQEPNLINKAMTTEENQCEEFYSKTTRRCVDGRYVVRLPMRSEDPECLYGDLKRIAQRRFHLLEKKLNKDPILKEDYKNVMEEYLSLNHMSLVNDNNELNNQQGVYIPHHAVVKRDRETTKVRVVFDASCKGINNVSLNDCLLIGPKLQQDLRHILMRWRCHPICLVSDIVKMYRQVCVHEDDTKYQQIVWRSDTNEPIKYYKLLRLTFGTACAPYLAVKTLQKLAKDEECKYPKASKITLQDFYMDDLMSGCQTEEEAIEIYEEMNQLMNSGGFELQKWCSNSQKVKDYINKMNQSKENCLPITESDTLKILGIIWNKSKDCFEYTVKLSDLSYPITKRKVLSDIARLYDPMGWIAPIIITAKLYIQKLWKSRLDWDDELSPELLKEWISYRDNLKTVQHLVIPRWINMTKSSKVQLHAFSDASNKAYAAVIYIKVTNENGETFVHLISAKTKVAPIEKEISIPRLELCGALLATKLLFEVATIMSIPKQNLFAWTDSTVVLAWLNGLPNRWTTFVSNRVSEILNVLTYEQWGHVSTNENPADAASRGLPAQALTSHSLWWSGPTWLHEPVVNKKSPHFVTTEEERPKKLITTTSVIQDEQQFIWTRYSTLSRMLKVVSYCRRVFKQSKPKSILVDTNELNETLEMCIKQCQRFNFSKEIKQIRQQQRIEKQSPLYTLNSFLDEKDILRVGGRIDRAQVEYEKRHPIILPSKSHLTNLLITDAHIRTLHGGPQIMLNYLRSKFWILRAREQVKKHYRKCIPCMRYSRVKHNQLMGQLPAARITPTRPFKSSGVDFTGFIKIRFSPGRGSKSYKGYICVFVCMVTRALHLEAVSDLTAQGFINAFRRFVSRRGHCSDLYSDNGTNFVGACKILEDLQSKASTEIPKEIKELLVKEGTTWHFIPPHAPNFGGLWEAGVRSVKTHLRKVIGESTLTFEELSTVLTEIEACLNSRPLSQLSENPEDALPLTPGHFLVGEPLVTIPHENVSNINITGRNRWLLTQKIVNDFWKRWADEYLVILNQRYKWQVQKLEPEINDIVIIRDDNLPPAKWWLGRVVEKHPGKDSITRVVTLKTKNGFLKRPCNKLCFLPKDC